MNYIIFECFPRLESSYIAKISLLAWLFYTFPGGWGGWLGVAGGNGIKANSAWIGSPV